MEKLLLLIIESLELVVRTSLVHIIMKYIVIAKCHIITKLWPKDAFGMLDRFFICASYLFGILANKAVMLYCCHMSRFTGVTTTGCLRLNFCFQNGYNIPVHWRAYVNVEGLCSSCDISINGCVSQCYMRMIRTSILSLLLAGGFCFRIQELVVEICVDSVVLSIVYTSTVERYRDGNGGVWKVVEGREVLGTGCENVFIYSFVV